MQGVSTSTLLPFGAENFLVRGGGWWLGSTGGSSPSLAAAQENSAASTLEL